MKPLDQIKVIVILLIAVTPIALIDDIRVYAQSDSGAITMLTYGWALEVDGERYNIRFLPRGDFAIQNMTIDHSAKALIVTLGEGHGNGNLEIALPKKVINSLGDNQEAISYEVLVDGDQASFIEDEEQIDERILKISIEPDVKEIIIIGTYVIPEFGPATAILLGVGIFAMIALAYARRQYA